MSRPRKIKPTLWNDPNFGGMSADAQILFIGCFSNADDFGRLRAHPLYLNSVIFPYKTPSHDEILKIRKEVEENMTNFVIYKVTGEEYIQLLKWNKHQPQQKKRIQPSDCPSPDKQVISRCVASDKQIKAKDTLDKIKLSKEKLSITIPFLKRISKEDFQSGKYGDLDSLDVEILIEFVKVGYKTTPTELANFSIWIQEVIQEEKLDNMNCRKESKKWSEWWDKKHPVAHKSSFRNWLIKAKQIITDKNTR